MPAESAMKPPLLNNFSFRFRLFIYFDVEMTTNGLELSKLYCRMNSLSIIKQVFMVKEGVSIITFFSVYHMFKYARHTTNYTLKFQN